MSKFLVDAYWLTGHILEMIGLSIYFLDNNEMISFINIFKLWLIINVFVGMTNQCANHIFCQISNLLISGIISELPKYNSSTFEGISAAVNISHICDNILLNSDIKIYGL